MGVPGSWASRLGPQGFSVGVLDSLDHGFVGTRTSIQVQFQAKPCRCSSRVLSIIGRIDLGCGSKLMLVLIFFDSTIGKISMLLPDQGRKSMSRLT
jgi:hypothetical protein